MELGLGLIGIGRPWPDDSRPVHSEGEARSLLEAAVELGVRTFDTAPAYGLSEARLGAFLATLEPAVRSTLSIASKAGELWSSDTGSSVDHTVEGLEESLQSTLALLGPLDVLQLHKGQDADLAEDALLSWFEKQRRDGTAARIGISTSSPDTLRSALALDVFDVVQFPANSANTAFVDVFLESSSIAVPFMNRPMASGQLKGKGHPFQYLVRTVGRGVVLSGASSPEHLAENVALFRAVERT